MSVTERDVHGACDQISEAGDKPTHRKVRERLGQGSFATIDRHMQTWAKPTNTPRRAARHGGKC